jgi:CpeT/CpcT family (DUF1001)
MKGLHDTEYKGSPPIKYTMALWPYSRVARYFRLLLLATWTTASGFGFSMIPPHEKVSSTSLMVLPRRLEKGLGPPPVQSSAPSASLGGGGGGETCVDPAVAGAATDNGRTVEQLRAGPVWNRLVECFQGDFDNYRQVVEDRKRKLLPREGGGHEHFHCTLVPVNNGTGRLAAFFFDGNPSRIFRFRYYELVDDAAASSAASVGNDVSASRSLRSCTERALSGKDTPDVGTTSETVEMRLYTLHPELESLLRERADDPLSWPSLYESFRPASVGEPKMNLLPRCEIAWSLEKDPEQHSYAFDIPEELDCARADPNEDDDGGSNDGQLRSLHAVMVHGEAIVESTIVPGMQIRILDQLSLYRDAFYINDRGFDPVTGAFIYGNQRDVPYRLERVTTLQEVPPETSSSSLQHDVTTSRQSYRSGCFQRKVVDPDLGWTLGPQWRTPEEYDRRLKDIGGPSVGINKKGFNQSNNRMNDNPKL